MNTLVTGGGGFLGRYIVEQLLARGDQVTVFARGSYPELAQAGARLIRGDLTDAKAIRDACAGIDVVFHVAAKAGLWGTWDSFYQANVTGTQHVIDACMQQGVPKLVYTSSPSVVFDNHPHRGVDESYPYPDRYESFYAHTKALGEQLVLAVNSPGLLTVSLRPHIIWGPRDTQIIPRLVARAKAGKLVQVGDGRNKVGMAYVEDAARAHLQAADALAVDSPVAGSVYFITQEEPVVLWDFVNEMLARLEVPPVKRQVSLPLARALGGLLEWGFRTFNLAGEPRLTRFLASELAIDHYYDISRAQRDFGFAPQMSLEEGMARTVEYFRQVGT
ncbi:MAG: NAD-dependent epimerase/dehydratase family protein [Anaerolineae bacterium]|nr:NAD-dependent epimerase/dehydratase family protein [Anaerolineae bacterium]